MAKSNKTATRTVQKADGVDTETISAPDRHPDGRLTLDGMRSVISRGQSVEWKNQVVSKLEDLPDEAEYAEGHEDMEASAIGALDAQQAKLDDQRKRLLDAQSRRKAGKPSLDPAHPRGVVERARPHAGSTGGGDSELVNKTLMESGHESSTGSAPDAVAAILGRRPVK